MGAAPQAEKRGTLRQGSPIILHPGGMMQAPGPDQFLLFHYIDSAGILMILGGMVHILVKVGSMKTKIDTMWNWFGNKVIGAPPEKGSGD